jgi:hypothetical protein
MRSLNIYTKNAPAALRIFDTFSKTTFATLSAHTGSDLLPMINAIEKEGRYREWPN